MVELDFDKGGGLIAAIVQDHETGEVLQVSWQNAEAFQRTRETGRMHYFSRSRGKLWMKGETSGHVQEVHETFVDCDLDAAVYKVRQHGGACHTGYRSCFHRRLEPSGEVTVIEKDKLFDPAQVYSQ